MRRRRNVESQTDRLVVEGSVSVPPPQDHWHPIAKRWYEALAESGQSRFYEPSDWAYAVYVAEAMHRNLDAGRFSAQLLATVTKAMSVLLVTEGDRRRMRLELERVDARQEAEQAEQAIYAYMTELGAAPPSQE